MINLEKGTFSFWLAHIESKTTREFDSSRLSLDASFYFVVYLS